MKREDSSRVEPVRVLICDPHEVSRRAVSELIADSPSFAVVGECSCAGEGREEIRSLRPDVVLLIAGDEDVGDGIHQILDLAPATNILVLSRRHDGAAVAVAVRSGALGFLPEWVPPEEVLDALMRVARGEPVVHDSVAADGLVWAARHLGVPVPEGNADVHLTPREEEMLGLLFEGLGPRGIAERLTLSRRTVEFHLAKAYRKLGVHGRIAAIREYRRLVESEERGNERDRFEA